VIYEGWIVYLAGPISWVWVPVCLAEEVPLLLTGRTLKKPDLWSFSKAKISPVSTPSARLIATGTVICPRVLILAKFPRNCTLLIS
jgi:hypothetical protein